MVFDRFFSLNSFKSSLGNIASQQMLEQTFKGFDQHQGISECNGRLTFGRFTPLTQQYLPPELAELHSPKEWDDGKDNQEGVEKNKLENS